MVLPGIRTDYMWFLQRLFKWQLVLLCIGNGAFGQKVNKVFYKDSTAFYLIKDTLQLNKIIPAEFKDAIRIALHYYPELTTARIHFRIKKAISPLAARPTFWAIFKKPAKRRYLVTISSSSITKLNPILLKNLSFNAQVGVIGHELAHVHFFQTKRGIYFIGLALKHLNKRAIDKFEFNTDKRCIEQGLGFQLLSWSREVREKLDLKAWGGSDNVVAKRERYMNPATIIGYLKTLPLCSKQYN